MCAVQHKADSDQIRRQNRGLVLEALRRGGALARIELGRATSLSPATITSITSDLIEEGIIRGVEDEGGARSGPGRPQIKLALDGKAGTVLGIRISVDEVRFDLKQFDGTHIAGETIALPSYEAAADSYGRAVAERALAFLKAHNISVRTILHTGVAVQGIADVTRGAIAWSPAFTARDVALAGPLEEALGTPVTIANDGNLMARVVAERNAGLEGTTLVVFVGYGVGMGIVINGAVYGGPTGAAAEFGHMNHEPDGPLCRCGRRGCIEAYAADYAILRASRGSALEEEPTHHAVDASELGQVTKDARANVPAAVAAFAAAGRALGFGLARAVALLNAGRVVIAGPGAAAYELMRPALEEGFRNALPDALGEGTVIEAVSTGQDLIVDGLFRQVFSGLDRNVFARAKRADVELRA